VEVPEGAEDGEEMIWQDRLDEIGMEVLEPALIRVGSSVDEASVANLKLTLIELSIVPSGLSCHYWG
jgi:hypothetical protein